MGTLVIRTFSNFDLLVDDLPPDASGARRVRVRGLNFSADATSLVPLDMETVADRLERRKLSPDNVADFGAALADTLLPQPIREQLVRSLDGLPAEHGLRLRLRLPADLRPLPWEYLYLPREREPRDATGFLALDPRISITRFEALSQPAAWDPSPRTRRVLGILADPHRDDQDAALDLGRERRILEEALDKVAGVTLDLAEAVTPSILQDRLQAGADVFHFAGHASFRRPGVPDVREGGGILLLGDAGGPQRVPADQLAVNLWGRGVRLAVLGACETGRRAAIGGWGGVADTLLRAGIPAVVAMQFKVWDEAALEFSRTLYRALAAGLPLDQAVSAGRLAAYNRVEAEREDPEGVRFWRDWGVPVLYLRADQNFVLPSSATPQEKGSLAESAKLLVDHRFGVIGPKARYNAITVGHLSDGSLEARLKAKQIQGEATQVKAGTVTGGSIRVDADVDFAEGTVIGVHVDRMGGPEAIPGPPTSLPPTPAPPQKDWPSRHKRFKERGESELEQPDEDLGAGGQSPAPDSLPFGLPTEAAETPSTPPTAVPPRTAYARLDCPEVVVAKKEFAVQVGLADKQQEGVVSPGPLRLPPSAANAYTLTIQLVAEGFTLRDGEPWRRDVRVTGEIPYPTLEFRLTAAPQTEGFRSRAVQALYSVDGQTIGMAVRPVTVARSQDLVAGAQRETPPPFDVILPTDRQAPDLTVRIQRNRNTAGGLLWTFDTPHRGVTIPDRPEATDLGTDRREFSVKLVHMVNAREGKPGLYLFLRGVGNTIAEVMPDAFWPLLHAVTERAGGPPSLLLLSEEPYVPWELAIVQPPLDSSEKPFLGMRAAIGRWVLARRPKLPPPNRIDFKDMAVISGVYNKPGWNRLKAAEEEAQRLQQDYQAQPVDAVTKAVLSALQGTPRAEVLHFAIHGLYDPASTEQGLVLVDGHYLDPLEVKGGSLPAAPLAFLNACQVGSASELLGDYAGMAEAFLYAGAAGVVAPLWSINDSLAREVALRFYREALAGATPAEFLRSARAEFGPESTSSISLAYQFFGHPALRLRRASS
jgi:CHAT domain-containing protein